MSAQPSSLSTPGPIPVQSQPQKKPSAFNIAVAEGIAKSVAQKTGYTYSPSQLAVQCSQLNSDYLIESLIPKKSRGILVGDSNIGKTPFAYQMAICIAAGVPFIGLKTKPGRVLYMDYENGLLGVTRLFERLVMHLKLDAASKVRLDANLKCWSPNNCDPDWGTKGHGLEQLVLKLQPDLCIIDTLSAHRPEAEGKNQDANKFWGQLRDIMKKCETSFLLLHHLRKPNEERGSVRLENGSKAFFNQTRGASSLVNGCGVRLAVDEPDDRSGKVAVIFGGFTQLSGELPLMKLTRVCDEEGDPLGYGRLTGVDLLSGEDWVAFEKLPRSFTFKEAKHSLSKGDQITTDILKRLVASQVLGKTVVHRTSTLYQKLA